MKVKLTTPLAGDRFSFSPGQIIECSRETGERLVAHDAGLEAEETAQVEGKLVGEEPLRERRGGPAESTGPETAVAAGDPQRCHARTSRGNPCHHYRVDESKYCRWHQDADEGGSDGVSG